MKAIILCAGYGTRLYPITKNFPKSLLLVARKEIISYLVEKLNIKKQVDHIYIAVNSKFFYFFKNWDGHVKSNIPISIIDNKTTHDEEKLGSIGDLQYVIENAHIKDDVLVLPGDNLYEFDISELVDFFHKKKAPVIAAYDMKDKEKIKNNFSSLDFDSKGKVTYFEEKPKNPRTSITCPAFYIYPKDFLGKVKEYLEAGNNPDAPGHFVEWAYKDNPIYAYLVKEDRYDIGTIDSYNETNKIFNSRFGYSKPPKKC